ncbi:MAG: hypothetical protein DME30_02515 [Verrucomicrobia bacterium]|nr:MAG: hypothetical protein DME30_02515 [Verrucomicrobiota bacterium]
MTSQQHAPLGIKLLAAFFAFGAGICLITIVALLFPGGALDPIWRLNPDAHVAFQEIGRLSILLMVVVGSACALAAVGLATRARWGVSLALGILIVNLVGDLLNAFVRHDLRTLIGLPIGGAMIAYLLIARR